MDFLQTPKREFQFKRQPKQEYSSKHRPERWSKCMPCISTRLNCPHPPPKPLTPPRPVRAKAVTKNSASPRLGPSQSAWDWDLVLQDADLLRRCLQGNQRQTTSSKWGGPHVETSVARNLLWASAGESHLLDLVAELPQRRKLQWLTRGIPLTSGARSRLCPRPPVAHTNQENLLLRDASQLDRAESGKNRNKTK